MMRDVKANNPPPRNLGSYRYLGAIGGSPL